MLTVYGACAVTFMMLMYALERRGQQFVLAFAIGCLLSSSYGFLAGTWPFGIVEAIWAAIAAKRYIDLRGRSNSRTIPAVEDSSTCEDQQPRMYDRR